MVREACGKGRAIVKNVRGAIFCLLKRLLEDLLVFPEFEDFFLTLNEREILVLILGFHALAR